MNQKIAGGWGQNSAMKNAIDVAYGQGVLTVVAAGNSDDDACDYIPAHVQSAITVGSTQSDDSRSGCERSHTTATT